MECLSPIFVRKSGIFVRCGKCLPCVDTRIHEWAVRLLSDFRQALTAYFITLTFNDEYLEKNGQEIDVAVFQRFLKRLRHYDEKGMPNIYKGKKVSKIDSKGRNLKYFACGEYGTKFGRVHWHMILIDFPYNIEDAENIISFAWTEESKSNGFDRIAQLTESRIYYTLDYLFKNEDKKAKRLISKHIGKSYLTDKKIGFHRKQQGGYTVLQSIKYPLPRYLKNQLYNEKERKEIGIKGRDYLIDQLLKDPEIKEKQYQHLKQKVEYKKRKRL